jgi:hypothetical protein
MRGVKDKATQEIVVGMVAEAPLSAFRPQKVELGHGASDAGSAASGRIRTQAQGEEKRMYEEGELNHQANVRKTNRDIHGKSGDGCKR